MWQICSMRKRKYVLSVNVCIRNSNSRHGKVRTKPSITNRNDNILWECILNNALRFFSLSTASFGAHSMLSNRELHLF